MRTPVPGPWLFYVAARSGCRATPSGLDAGRQHRAMCFCEPTFVPRGSFGGTCTHGRVIAHPSAPDRGEILLVAAPPRLRAPNSARRAAVFASQPSSRARPGG
jgi:hypothetical protein